MATIAVEAVMGGIFLSDMAKPEPTGESDARQVSGLGEKYVSELINIAMIFDCNTFAD